VFGTATPRWASDLYRLLSYFHTIEIMPTLLAILHCAGRVFPQILARRSMGY
jgi:hypothetical protein